jgi:choline transport protein
VVLSLINIASTAAFNAIVGLATVALYFTYLMPIIMLVIRRINGDHIRFGPWKLGSLGLWINLFAIVYTVVTSIFLFFPSFIPVTPLNMNWSSAVFAATLLISLISWFVYGRRTYAGPLKEVED